MSDELRASLAALPEVESVERAMDVALLVRVEGEFVSACVLGTIAAHDWGRDVRVAGDRGGVAARAE